VLDAVRVIIAQHEPGIRVMAPVDDYEAQSVSKKIVRIVLSYTEYINRTVWNKNS
jgi:UDP-N-acetylglucosamine 2-epimerase (non-hydrolysing)